VIDPSPDISEALRNARQHLLSLRNSAGHWEGELSSSALSTATAAIALHLVDPRGNHHLVRGALQWLAEHQNDDGGWGDTTRSFSNISTTLLAHAATHLVTPGALPLEKSTRYITGVTGSMEPGAIASTVAARYGKDRTFSVPILMACTIGGILGEKENAWRRVLPLPFELAAFPRKWFAALRMPVVSYALPALIAIGYTRFHNAPPRFAPFRWLRRLTWPKVSELLRTIQPASGGYLEATPLTSFVTMALASSGEKDHPVIPEAIGFLQRSVRPDGSWPIDTNLATWVTGLAVKALGSKHVKTLPPDDLNDIRDWLLGQQYRTPHPFTESPPGGWAWTDLSGGVPDGDDTPGTLIALRCLSPLTNPHPRTLDAVGHGANWLLGLQNRDGGMPTFCRGWGTLPFDRSSPDLTAHALRAWKVWQGYLPEKTADWVRWATRQAFDYLNKQQEPDGAWNPLWFGNQHSPDEVNRTYGTAAVLRALAVFSAADHRGLQTMREQGMRWLVSTQNPDGGWGGDTDTPSSVEETALALDALAATGTCGATILNAGTRWLISATDNGTRFDPSPVGFYFAKLWYWEKLYPVVWSVSALRKVQAVLGSTAPSTRPAAGAGSASS